jgi:hypothetical protein
MKLCALPTGVRFTRLFCLSSRSHKYLRGHTGDSRKAGHTRTPHSEQWWVWFLAVVVLCTHTHDMSVAYKSAAHHAAAMINYLSTWLNRVGWAVAGGHLHTACADRCRAPMVREGTALVTHTCSFRRVFWSCININRCTRACKN